MTKLVGVTAVLLLSVVAVVFVAIVDTGAAQDPQDTATAFQAPVDVDTAGLPGPTQPIFYRHDVHAGQYQMDCRYCHFAVEISSSPGMPTMSTCMGCHIIAGAGNPEVEKLRTAWNEREPVEWVEVHRLGSFVRFPHNRHVQSDLGPFEGKGPTDKCVECHGMVSEMPQVYQVATLKMGWCLDCHKESEASIDCTVCHY